MAYDDFADMPRLRKKLEESLEEYNETFAIMPLVLFEDACKHVTRISRSTIQEGGHSLLVGVGGSGKQSLSRMGGYMNRYKNIGIVVTSD
jgi:dynein heavy chain